MRSLKQSTTRASLMVLIPQVSVLLILNLLVLINDLEEMFQTKKFNALTDHIDLNRMMTSKKIAKLLANISGE